MMSAEVTGKQRRIQAKCVASVTNCGLGLETAMAPTVNRGWQLFINDKYMKSSSKIFHIKRRLKQVFELNDCFFPDERHSLAFVIHVDS